MAVTEYLSGWDIFAVVAYFGLVLGASVYTMFRHNRSTVEGYFLAGRGMIWVYVGASLFASNIGSEHFIGLAGSGAASGISVGAFELNAMLVLQVLGWVFLPVFISSAVSTLPEYMKKRFGGARIRVYLSVLSLVLYIFTKISVNLYSGALFIKVALGWNLYYAVLFVLAVTAFSTITGGLAAVIYTDTLQAIIMVIGGLTLMVISFTKIGTYEDLYVKYMNAIPEYTLEHRNMSSPYANCGMPDRNSFRMLRDIQDSNMPWLGFLLGQTPASIWYWCSDQMMVQRALAAKSLAHAKGGTLLAGYIKILPFFMMVLPGMISRVLFKDTVGCADPDTCMKACGSKSGCSNLAYPLLIMNIMPTGLKGLMLAVMLAALMSDLTSIFNSASTLFTIDIFQQFKKDATNLQLMIVGRLFVVFMVAVGIAWIPIIMNMQGGQLYIYIQSIAAYLAPPIAAVYVLAIMWKRGNEKGAFFGLMVGMVAGVTRMILDFVYIEPPCGEVDKRPAVLKNFHYLYFAMLLYWLTTITMIVVTLCTSESEYYRTIRTTFWTQNSTEPRPDEGDIFAKAEPALKGSNLTTKTINMISPIDDQTEAQNAVKFVNSQTPIVTITDIDGNNSNSAHQQRPQNAKQWFKRIFLNWICGIETSNSTAKQKNTETTYINVKETRCEKWILNTNLVFIICISVALFLFFSIPPESHIFKHLNVTSVFNKN